MKKMISCVLVLTMVFGFAGALEATPYTTEAELWTEAYNLEAESDVWADDYGDDFDWQTWYAEQIDAKKIALGGVPGEFSVMFDGAYLAFEGTGTFAMDGRIYAPADAMCAQMGIDLPAGVETLERRDDTYVGVRSLGESLGYWVLWDGDYTTAVLVDADALIAQADSRFTILNDVLAAQQAAVAGIENTTGTIDSTLTITAEGEDYVLPYQIEVHASRTAVAMYITAQLEEIAPLLSAFGAQEALSLDDMTTYMQLLPYLKNFEATMLLDLETGLVYVNAPILAVIMDLAEDAWLELDLAALTGMDMVAYLALAQDMQEYTVGSLGLYMGKSMMEGPYGAVEAVYAYERLTGGFAEAANWIGDDAFAADGDGYTMTLDNAKIDELLGISIAEILGNMDVNLSLSVTKDGGITLAASVEQDINDEDMFWDIPELLAANLLFAATPFTADYDLSIDMGAFAFRLVMTAEEEATGEAPVVTPAEGAVIIPWNFMF